MTVLSTLTLTVGSQQPETTPGHPVWGQLEGPWPWCREEAPLHPDIKKPGSGPFRGSECRCVISVGWASPVRHIVSSPQKPRPRPAARGLGGAGSRQACTSPVRTPVHRPGEVSEKAPSEVLSMWARCVRRGLGQAGVCRFRAMASSGGGAVSPTGCQEVALDTFHPQ